jgi:hypothetical protein
MTTQERILGFLLREYIADTGSRSQVLGRLEKHSYGLERGRGKTAADGAARDVRRVAEQLIGPGQPRAFDE